MKQVHLGKAAIAVSVFACAATLSFNWSEQQGASLSVESAQARVGRPATPVSVAGVARRQTRRAVYGPSGYAAGAVGAGLATAGAVAATAAYGATAPYYGGDPNYANAYYSGGYSGGAPYYSGGYSGYYGGGPYAAYYGNPYNSGYESYTYSGGPRGIGSYAYYGAPYQDYATRNGFVCQPGTLVRLEDGRMHPCQ
jgi:hypothetical protein